MSLMAAVLQRAHALRLLSRVMRMAIVQSNLCNAHKGLAFLSHSSIGVVIEHSG